MATPTRKRIREHLAGKGNTAYWTMENYDSDLSVRSVTNSEIRMVDNARRKYGDVIKWTGQAELDVPAFAAEQKIKLSDEELAALCVEKREAARSDGDYIRMTMWHLACTGDVYMLAWAREWLEGDMSYEAAEQAVLDAYYDGEDE